MTGLLASRCYRYSLACRCPIESQRSACRTSSLSTVKEGDIRPFPTSPGLDSITTVSSPIICLYAAPIESALGHQHVGDLRRHCQSAGPVQEIGDIGVRLGAPPSNQVSPVVHWPRQHLCTKSCLAHIPQRTRAIRSSRACSPWRPPASSSTARASPIPPSPLHPSTLQSALLVP